jgi:hypothetical protein
MLTVQNCTTDPPLFETPGPKSLAGMRVLGVNHRRTSPVRHQEVVMSRIQISLSTPTFDQLRAIAGTTSRSRSITTSPSATYA